MSTCPSRYTVKFSRYAILCQNAKRRSTIYFSLSFHRSCHIASKPIEFQGRDVVIDYNYPTVMTHRPTRKTRPIERRSAYPQLYLWKWFCHKPLNQVFPSLPHRVNEYSPILLHSLHCRMRQNAPHYSTYPLTVTGVELTTHHSNLVLPHLPQGHI